MTAAGRRPRRVAITLKPSERDALAALAHRAREPEATTAARLLRAALIDHGAALDAAVRQRNAPPAVAEADAGSGAAWLPPSRRAVAIEALRDRYPHELKHLRGDPLADTHIAEQAAALSLWREQIDNGNHADPRMELAFSHELRTFANWLQTNARRHR
ncbi:hypothetical protein VSS74_12205 [Conexibacter stalactiti]|uniref:Ribbon-helix-helix protein CopG domain-containing protein n=1 Tax=Conexibacter stalactiti TaxID=1940611 RepID=A0ABU4HP85_9ACTN|nr:hypothetical protein [Conexibacter stalactiti]MDW5595106.1 hypothetical protein [Conexibacter stalactiti]MEC5035748.1 hypothetical protein [Conexibacter stalactiti]